MVACIGAGQRSGAASGSALVTRHATVLLSLDGFRADYLARPGAVHLRALAALGVRAEQLIPAFPSKTFPNHYTIATGLHPEHHGIVANMMYDAVIGSRFSTGGALGRAWPLRGCKPP